MKRTRRNHAPGFKAKVAIAAIKGDKTLAEIAEHFELWVARQVGLLQRRLIPIGSSGFNLRLRLMVASYLLHGCKNNLYNTFC